MECKSAEELLALAKTEGFDMTKEEAEAYRRNWPTMNWTVTKLKK